MNAPILTYDEWCDRLIAKAHYKGREFQNVIIREKNGQEEIVLEDFVKGERVIIEHDDIVGADLTLSIGTDPRWIYLGNRNPSDVMEPDYIAVGADKWEFPTDEWILKKYPNRAKLL